MYIRLCGSSISGWTSIAACRATWSRVGETSMKRCGLAMRNMQASTRNWDPRDSTEKKSIPKMRAISLVCERERSSERCASVAHLPAAPTLCAQ